MTSSSASSGEPHPDAETTAIFAGEVLRAMAESGIRISDNAFERHVLALLDDHARLRVQRDAVLDLADVFEQLSGEELTAAARAIRRALGVTS